MTTGMRFGLLLLSAGLTIVAACSSSKDPERGAGGVASGSAAPFRTASEKQAATDAAIDANLAAEEGGTQARRARWQGKTFEEFEASVYREPGPGGKYIVSGDIAIADRKHLEEFFTEQILTGPVAPAGLSRTRRNELAVFSIGGEDKVWNSTDKKRLTYCVSTAFGTRHTKVAADLGAAGQAWEQCADVDFVYVAAEDGNCTAGNTNVTFDVNPVSVNGRYLARAFFPNEPRSSRNVLIDETSFRLDPTGKMQLTGILRHELGHTLGLRHEQTRPEAGACYEDDDWRPLTSYDRFSVMHYPQCNGGGDWSLTLTAHDKSGVACLYGAATGFHIDPSLVDLSTCRTGATPSSQPSTTKTFAKQKIAQDEEKPYPAFRVVPGSRFNVRMTPNGSAAGDPDLYVRFGQAPARDEGGFNCRPYLSGADEQCSLDVPDWASEVFVMVHGYTPGKYDLVVTSIASAD